MPAKWTLLQAAVDGIEEARAASNAGSSGELLEQASELAVPARLRALLDDPETDERKLLEPIANQLGVEWIGDPSLTPEVADIVRPLFSARLAVANEVLPLSKEDERFVIACYNPFDLVARQEVVAAIDGEVAWVMSPRSNILAGIQDLYGVGAETFDEILADRADRSAADLDFGDVASDLDGDDQDAAVIRFVNQIIRDALKQRATDIHVEPLEDDLRIRYRVDGILQEAPVPRNIKQLQSMVIARLKVMAKLDIAERRLPQDGRIHLQNEGLPIDVRVATIPSVEGESVSLRLLGREAFSLDKLDFSPKIRSELEELLDKPNGIILVTGPTGCGKSTSLYTFLSKLNSNERRIVTIEDPVENKLPGVIQIAVRPEIDLTFANGLRSVLRGDPNIIMVGEIRDLETAEIAIRAALTGHLVLIWA